MLIYIVKMHLKDSDDSDLYTPALILFTWGWRQIQSPKRRVLKTRTMDNVQKINI
jgi:hypothetical protein